MYIDSHTSHLITHIYSQTHFGIRVSSFQFLRHCIEIAVPLCVFILVSLPTCNFTPFSVISFSGNWTIFLLFLLRPWFSPLSTGTMSPSWPMGKPAPARPTPCWARLRNPASRPEHSRGSSNSWTKGAPGRRQPCRRICWSCTTISWSIFSSRRSERMWVFIHSIVFLFVSIYRFRLFSIPGVVFFFVIWGSQCCTKVIMPVRYVHIHISLSTPE